MESSFQNSVAEILIYSYCIIHSNIDSGNIHCYWYLQNSLSHSSDAEIQQCEESGCDFPLTWHEQKDQAQTAQSRLYFTEWPCHTEVHTNENSVKKHMKACHTCPPRNPTIVLIGGQEIRRESSLNIISVWRNMSRVF